MRLLFVRKGWEVGAQGSVALHVCPHASLSPVRAPLLCPPPARSTPQASPLLETDEVLEILPPTYIITAEFDPLRDEGEELSRRLQLLHGTTWLTRVPG